MTTREYVYENFRSNDESGLAFIADLLESEGWTAEALEKIAYDSKMELPALVTHEETTVISSNCWRMYVGKSHTKMENDDMVGGEVPYFYPSTITVSMPNIHKFYNIEGHRTRMLYNCVDRIIESRYWKHSIGWAVVYNDGMSLTIEIDDTRHDYDFDEISTTQYLACELALNLVSVQEAISEDTYNFLTKTLGLDEKPVSRVYMAMHERRNGEFTGVLREKLLYIDGEQIEKGITAGDFCFLKFKHGLKKIYGRNEDDSIWNITFGWNGEIMVPAECRMPEQFTQELISWSDEVFKSF